jgi:Asp-tRNA(Asn)/Glu-tRNA(Gln) amidotransferase A subunit family amidase
MTHPTTDPWSKSATQTVEATRTGQAFSPQGIDAHRRRHQALNRSINAVVIVVDEQTMRAARTAPPTRGRTELHDGRLAQHLVTMRLAMAINTLGPPAPAAPAGVSDGLPRPEQVIGPRHREDLCANAAAAIQNHVGTIGQTDSQVKRP